MSSSNEDNDTNNKLERSSSQISTASRRSGTVRAAPRKHSVAADSPAKTLESFPSLSPDASPNAKHAKLPKTTGTKVPDNATSPTVTTANTPKKEPSTVQNLTQRTKSAQTRTALFEENTNGEIEGVPGALHHASDEHLRRLVKKTGAVTLVRQLASDLAERDAELTAFHRRADERERELKKMLREVEVSNLDIETRLHRIGNSAGSAKNIRATSISNPASPKGVVSTPSAKIPNTIGGIDAMVEEAMDENVGALEIDDGYLDSMSKDDREATVKAKGVPSRASDGQSTVSSIDSQGRPKGTFKGWKDYLWGSTATSRKTSKASSVTSDPEDGDVGNRTRGFSGNNGRRKGLKEDTFSPPTRASTTGDGRITPHSRRSSTGVASWTVNLFAGKSNQNRESDGQRTVRDRSSTTGNEGGKASRPDSTTLGPPPRSAKAALMRVSSMESSRLQSHKSVQHLAVNPKAGGKPAIPPVPPLPSPKKADTATNLGPVEMDTIHPPDSKPPTLMQADSKPADDLLTDPFGFIYDQRRRRKEAEATISHKRGKSNVSANLEMISSARASMKSPEPDWASQTSVKQTARRPETPLSTAEPSDEKPKKSWQEYLKVTTVPTELLLHTPSPKPGINVISADVSSPPFKRLATNGDIPQALPAMTSNAEPEISPIIAGKAELSKASTSKTVSESTPAIAEEEPVKLLLNQLTELHDTLQREKTVKWNDFLRKVRAERKKEGEVAATTEGRAQQAAMPEVMLTDGEIIGVSGLGNKGKVGRAKWKEFKALVLAGIPVAYRAKIWAECSGAAALRVPGYYDDLVRSGNDDPAVVSQIQMDIHRTLTDNVFFRKGPGVVKLNEVLLAYSRRNPEVGYCQGMNLITASLLLIVPTAEDAFWVLTSLIENILPQHYYDPTLLASRADQAVLRAYVSELLPRLSLHLDSLGIELDALTFQWFLSVFTDCLSAEALFRVWDVIFCFNDGSTFLFQIALALLKLNESHLLECDTAARVYGYIGNEMTDHAISIDGLVSAGEALKNVVKRSEVEEKRYQAVEEARGRERKGRASTAGSESTGSRELSLQEPRPVEEGAEAKA